MNYLSILKGRLQNMQILPREEWFPNFAHYADKYKIQGAAS